MFQASKQRESAGLRHKTNRKADRLLATPGHFILAGGLRPLPGPFRPRGDSPMADEQAGKPPAELLAVAELLPTLYAELRRVGQRHPCPSRIQHLATRSRIRGIRKLVLQSLFRA
jgi:hypothetical protein